MKIIQIPIFFLIIPSIGLSQDIGRIRDRIEFNDPFLVVQDSILRMRFLMEKLPKTNRVNYFVDAKGDLFVNNTKMTNLKKVVASQVVRRDTLFLDFSDLEYYSFYTLIHFLRKNGIASASFEPAIDEYCFHYKYESTDRYIDIRDIVIPERKREFLSRIKGRFKVLDQRADLILISPQ